MYLYMHVCLFFVCCWWGEGACTRICAECVQNEAEERTFSQFFLFENNNDLGTVHAMIQAYPDHEELSLVMKASVASVVIRLSMGSFNSELAV